MESYPPKFSHLHHFTLLLIIPTLFTLSLSTDIPTCNSNDQAVLLKIKAHFHGAGLLSDWDPKTDGCCDWPNIGCTSDYDSNPGRVNALTVGCGSGLSGNIPDIVGDLPFLDNLMFCEEPKLTGPIPESLSKLSKLRILSLNSNRLTGPVPGFLGQLKSLTQVDLSSNRFTGTIPPSLSGLSLLTEFNVSRNSLTGPIPAKLPKSLTSLDLSHNSLSGALPSQLTQLPLQFLDVSFNQLCGPLPIGGQLQRFGPSPFQHNKCLCGPPLPACK